MSFQTKGGFDRADIFIGVFGLFVLAFAIVLANTTSTGGEPSTRTSSPVTTRSASGGGAVLQGRRSQNTDEPDASIEASREAGNDQSGSPQQRAKLDEADGNKFTLGESMHGSYMRPGPNGRVENLVGGAWARHREYAAASDQLADAAKKKTEMSVADELADQATKRVESSVADELADQAKKAQKGTNSENLTARDDSLMERPGIAGYQGPLNATDPAGVPTHGSGEYNTTAPPSMSGSGYDESNPMDLFEDGASKYQTKPNIDFTGYGHMKYTEGIAGGNDDSRVFYPRSGRIFVYKRAESKYPWTKYSESQAGGAEKYYYQVSKQNDMIQRRRNRDFTVVPPVDPDAFRWQDPNQDFMPHSMPNFFKDKGGAWYEWNEQKNAIALNDWYGAPMSEYAMANELGTTGHSFTDNNPKSGLEPNEQKRLKAWSAGGGQGGSSGNPNLDPRQLEPEGDQEMKTRVRANVVKVVKLFDRLFSEEIFPDAVVDASDDGTMRVRDGKQGKCILLGRYYEYVQNSIKVTLGLGKASPMTWAKNIDLNFGAIQSNIVQLRNALTEDCDKASAFILSQDGTIKTHSGQEVKVVVPWPKDQTTLVSHPMIMGA